MEHKSTDVFVKQMSPMPQQSKMKVRKSYISTKVTQASRSPTLRVNWKDIILEDYAC